jgi:hypothetical protein
MQGRPLTDQEKAFIDSHEAMMFNGQIAQELARRYPQDNGGYRCQKSITKYLQRRQAGV